jgi:hypothetical protein
VRLGVDGLHLFTNFPDLLAGLTVPNIGAPPLSLLATVGALAVYGPLAIFGWLLLRGRTSEGS